MHFYSNKLRYLATKRIFIKNRGKPLIEYIQMSNNHNILNKKNFKPYLSGRFEEYS